MLRFSTAYSPIIYDHPSLLLERFIFLLSPRFHCCTSVLETVHTSRWHFARSYRRPQDKHLPGALKLLEGTLFLYQKIMEWKANFTYIFKYKGLKVFVSEFNCMSLFLQILRVRCSLSFLPLLCPRDIQMET